MNEPPRTPWQTAGPYLAMALDWPDGPQLVPEGTPGAVLLSGTLRDGVGEPVPNGLIEVWQVDPDGFGRCITDHNGWYWFRTVKPGRRQEAPHLTVSICTRGLLRRLITRVYFPDEPAANAADPVLGELPPADRALLTASTDGVHALRWDIALQGPDETPFFAL